MVHSPRFQWGRRTNLTRQAKSFINFKQREKTHEITFACLRRVWPWAAAYRCGWSNIYNRPHTHKVFRVWAQNSIGITLPSEIQVGSHITRNLWSNHLDLTDDIVLFTVRCTLPDMNLQEHTTVVVIRKLRTTKRNECILCISNLKQSTIMSHDKSTISCIYM